MCVFVWFGELFFLEMCGERRDIYVVWGMGEEMVGGLVLGDRLVSSEVVSMVLG